MIKKSLALMLCLIFPVTLGPSVLSAEVATPGSDVSLPLSDLAVPESLGKVQERFIGTSARTIIQVQDVHAHAVAQQNIASLLERLRTVFGVETAALEGAWCTTSLPKSHALPTSREKQLLSMTLLEDDRISGPAYAAIMSPLPITLVGIEESALYEKNRVLFLSHRAQASAIAEKLHAESTSLQALQRSSWPPELLSLASAVGSFHETSDLVKFFPLLLKSAETHAVDVADLAQIGLLRDILALEKTFEKERLGQEVKQVIRKYKDTPWSLEELLRGGKIPAEEIGLYPEIKKLSRLYKMRDELSVQELSVQIETLTRRVLEKLFRAPEEKALWEKTERFYLAKKILLLEASPGDLKIYEREKTSLETELAANGLSEALALSLEFYETVKKRDQVFFDKILSDPSLAGNIAVVTGGFHTDGLSERFREAGISYITIAPDLGGEAANKKLYNERMAASTGQPPLQSLALQTKPVFDRAERQTLSELQNSIAETDERFLEALKVLFQTKDVRKAVRVFRGETVAVSKDDKIRDLAARKRLRKNAGPETVSALNLKVSEFMTTLTHEEQLSAVKALLARAERPEHKPALISTVEALSRMAERPDASTRVVRALQSGDPVALLKNGSLPENLRLAASSGRVEFFEVQAGGMNAMVIDASFLAFIRHHPPVIILNHYANGKYPVLEEKPESLALFRIITLSPELYQAAKDPKFLKRLEGLIAEILSQELAAKAA